MAKNKIVYNGNTLIDLTGTTATADKILTGYGAFGKDGVWMDGTATSGSVTQDQDGFIVLPPTGGGSPSVSGLVYESGTWTPSEDVLGDNVTISFTNTHQTMPFLVSLVDVGNDYYGTFNTCFTFYYYSYYSALGGAVWSTESAASRYGEVRVVYRGASATATSLSTNTLTYSPTDTGAGTSAYPRYYVTESNFKPRSGTNYWRAGRTYKWIAVWAPTT